MAATVFIIDDDEAVRDSLKLLLESHGMAVADYALGEEFARHYRPSAGQCLILDQHLPGMSGLDFLASRQAASWLPVILLTGRGDASIEARAQALGVKAYLEKPVAEAVLLDAIRRALNGALRR